MYRALKVGIPTAALVVTTAIGWSAWGDNGRVRFPDQYRDGVHYATVNRGGIREEIFTSAQVLEAVRAGRSIPSGAVITMEDHRNGRLHRYVVMEKRAGWGAAYPIDVRNGDWEYREFRPDRTPNPSENGRRCMSCHQSQAANDFVWTWSRMRAAR